jgi:protoporphyrinogen oxidase
MNHTSDTILIVGAGPAGLTAAYELVRHGRNVRVVEMTDHVGGISRTETKGGYRFDIGGHRFFSKDAEVNALWQEMLGEEFLRVPRLSRIFFDGQFYDYPLSAFRTLWKLGVVESTAIVLSYLHAKAFPHRDVRTFEQWVVNRFGRRLFNTFFKTYTEKVWGMRCDQISADWAAQRIKDLSLKAALLHALLGNSDARSLINEFDYPRYGPGQMWERFRDAICARGAIVSLSTDAVRFHHDGRGTMNAVSVESSGGAERQSVSHVITSMPLPTLIQRLDPAPPPNVLEAARHLHHRDFILVGLVVNRPSVFPDNWIYIHSPGVSVGRIQNFKNWSADMLPDASKTSLGMEYFCTRGDALWQSSDDELIARAKRELEQLSLAKASDVERGIVIRQPMAYPIYDDAYQLRIAVIREYLKSFMNLQTVGRNGMHRYNNQDHSMLTGLYAARNVMGAHHDLWSINTERSYHESLDAKPASGMNPNGKVAFNV